MNRILQHIAPFLAAALLVVGLGAASAGASAQPATPMINNLELLRAIRDARGKVVVVNFFATWCAPCLVEIPALIDVRKEYEGDRVVLMGLSIDNDEAALDRFVDKMGFNFPVYRVGQDVSRTFRVSGVPKLMIYNKKGQLVVNHDGFVPEKELRRVLNRLVAQ
jgi:thiol-disulfide isomerase/thioredoxin